MTVLNLEAEIKKELKRPESWMLQLANLAGSFFWSVNAWIATTAIMIVFSLSIILLIPIEAEPITSASFGEFIDFYQRFSIFISIFSAFVVFVSGLPVKLKNVFRDIAKNRVERQREIFYQASLIESVLIRHNLITEEEAAQAKLEREKTNANATD